MAKLLYRDAEVDLQVGETVLDALLRHRLDVPSSCRNGVCHSCMMRCEEGEPGSISQKGLKDTLKAQGYFLACQCRPTESMKVSLEDVDQLFTEARLVSRHMLTPDVARLLLETHTPLRYQPGQFVHLRRPDGLLRSYSVASGTGTPSTIELHVGRIENGRMSSWLIDVLAVGDTVDVRGPSGGCYYLPDRPEQPMLLIGTGTGLAPLFGILRSALATGHRGTIHLYHGSYAAGGLYLVGELRGLAAEYEHFHYHACVDRDAEDVLILGRASDVALARHKDLGGWRVFLCGHPAMVKQAKQQAYLAGASLHDILSDPFEISPS